MENTPNLAGHGLGGIPAGPSPIAWRAWFLTLYEQCQGKQPSRWKIGNLRLGSLYCVHAQNNERSHH